MTPTPLRNIRVDDALWEAFKERVREDGTDASAKIRDLITEYINN